MVGIRKSIYELIQIGCCFLCFLLIESCVSNSEAIFPWNEEFSIEQNIAKNALALENNTEFHFLDNIVRNRSVLIIGETSHWDYTTIETRIKMIDYLKNKGFSSIALEGAPLLTSYVFSNPKYAELTKNWKINQFWKLNDLRDPKFQPFLESIQNRNIKIWGIDCCWGYYYDIDAVKTILEEYSEHEVLSLDWDRLRHLYFQKFVMIPCRGCPEPEDKLSVAEQYELMRMIDKISNHTQFIITSKGTNMDLKIILQWIRNLNMAFSYVEYAYLTVGSGANLTNRNRDYQMAENINWIIKNFPKERFTVWTANFHGAKDISQTLHTRDSLLYFSFQSMGETLYAEHENKIYSLAFTSLEEERWRGRLEMEIANATENAPFAFINFEPLRFADGYRDKEFESNVIGKKSGKWLYIFDGLYYVRDQEYPKNQ